jgi:hypothetical protein
LYILTFITKTVLRDTSSLLAAPFKLEVEYVEANEDGTPFPAVKVAPAPTGKDASDEGVGVGALPFPLRFKFIPLDEPGRAES